ncbi:MAG: orotidine-5'-phosphate decarboxylase [Bacteroidetes bacterium]|jgi:orotidine-5'-phosphate decarboxylase|nr:orotidine-5'-phosphate decarboxylase [Bacteroidota bacterium]MCC6693431.1 orotidine-5'-phosphate decarboxylase [Chitinophagaceae bacterium]
MHRNILVEQINQKKSYLCVGLDTDFSKIPKHLQSHPNAIVEFNKAIIDATKDHCVSYKINTAFYEALGVKGWQAMEETVACIPSTHLKIADAKRGDIGNTSSHYAKAFFETINFDAITVAPYMGEDSIRPFLEYENKWTIVLGLTSNKGAGDFEMLKLVNDSVNHITQEDSSALRNEYLYENVLKKVASWGTPNNLMFVVGATQATEFNNIRTILPDHFLLVPGVGFQGGSLKEISLHAMNKDCGILVNASRAIIYAGTNENFAAEAKAIAEQYHTEMKLYLK